MVYILPDLGVGPVGSTNFLLLLDHCDHCIAFGSLYVTSLQTEVCFVLSIDHFVQVPIGYRTRCDTLCST